MRPKASADIAEARTRRLVWKQNTMLPKKHKEC
jgi:hypothetical protein